MASGAFNRRRRALLFGNDAYPTAPLNSCCKDARDMSETLRALNFDCTAILNASKKQMEKAESDLRRKIQENDCVLIYFSGHGREEGVMMTS